MNRVVLVGDPSGAPDEGMKKIGREIEQRLNSLPDFDVHLISVSRALRGAGVQPNTDLVHYLMGPSWRSFIYCSLIKRRQRSTTRSIITFVHPHWSPLAEWCYRLFSPDAVIVQSEKWLTYCRQETTSKVFSVPISGVDLSRFKPVDKIRREQIRAELEIDPKERVVLHVGHLNKGRNLHVMTQLLKLPHVSPMIIASTTVEPESYVLRTLQRAGIKVIRRYIRNIEKYYQAADCYLFPTTNPNFSVQIPLSVLEALACGLPVVTTPFEGLPLYLPKANGLTYLYDEDSLCDVVWSVIEGTVKPDPEVLSRFSWEVVVENLANCYQEVLRGGSQ